MKLYGVTIISSDGDILVTKENGEKDWAESKTKVFLDKQDCIDYAVNEVKKAFENYEFEDGVDENGSDINMFTDDLLAGEDICIQGCSSHISARIMRRSAGYRSKKTGTKRAAT